MIRVVLVSMLVGCAVPRGGLPEFQDGDSGVDASIDSSFDSSFDSSLDAPGVDAPGIDAPMPDAGVDAGDCALGARSCAGTTLQECTAGGLVDVRECRRGCSAGTCTAYDVRNVTMDRFLHVGVAALDIAGGERVTLNTDTGEIILDPDTQLRPPGAGLMNGISYERQSQAGPPGLAIFSFGSLTIDAGGTLTARGSDVPVILVGGDALIDGVIDVSANGRSAGVGGTNGGTHGSNGGGTAGGESGETRGAGQGQLSGGGGGGHAGNGGMGGSNSSAQGGQGGMAIGDDSGGTPLIGGGGGGGGASFFDDGSHGGGGGGAVQVSAGGSILVNGVVRANGAGGDAGYSAGGGGGAGGSVVLQAPRIDITGAVVSNGGGGGGGQGISFDDADPGQPGRDDRTSAAGGNGVAGGGNGGQGGAGGNLTGGNGTSGGPAAGGGGAAGRVSLYTEGGASLGTVSPDAIMGDIP